MKTCKETKANRAFGKITAFLIAACAAALSTTGAAQTTMPAAPTTGAAPAIPRAAQPITLEINSAGDIARAIDANGAAVPKRDATTPMSVYLTDGQKQYLVGTGTMANPGNPAAMIQANCLQEQGRGWQCWPRDRSGWLQVNRQGVQRVYYVSDGGQSVPARRPAGAPPVPMPGKEFSFGRRPQPAGAARQAPGAVFEAAGSCPCCIDGVCWDPFPQCS